MIPRRDFLMLASGAPALVRQQLTGSSRDDAQQAAVRGGVCNVLDYGAKGDGAADDTAAFNAATAAAAAGPAGSTVFIPRGTYRLTAPLVITASNLNFIGQSLDNTVLDFNGEPYDSHGLEFRGCANVTIRDVSVLYAQNCGIAMLGRVDGYPRGCSHFLIEKVRIDRPKRRGLYVGGAIMSQFRDVLVYSPTTGDGFVLSGGSTSLTFIGCYALAVRGDGFVIDHLAYSAFIGCGCDRPGKSGYHVAATSSFTEGLTFVSCGTEDAALAGFLIEAAAGGTVRGINLTGCYVAGAGQADASFLQVVRGAGAIDDIVVQSGVDTVPRRGAAHSIAVDGAGTKVIVVGGTFALPHAATGGGVLRALA